MTETKFFTPTFKADISAKAIKTIENDPTSWNQSAWHWGSVHCWAGHCEIVAFPDEPYVEGSPKEKLESMGLSDTDWEKMTDADNSLARLKALHNYHVTGVYGNAGFDDDGYSAEGFDFAGFDRQGYDIDGFDVNGYDRDYIYEEGYND